MAIMETMKFTIRETEFKDYEHFARMETDPDIIRFLSFDSDRTYEDVVTECFHNIQDPMKQDYTIVDRETGLPVGRIYLSRIDKSTDSLDITKYYMDKAYWGHGYSREILKELLEYCFTFLHMERVTLDHFAGNKRAAALYTGLGFNGEGVARNATKKDGKYYDLHLMSILRSEFFGEID
ncbi:MAG: GNAT family N-acetyltransferase [Eubacterium sp.]|nr:GNAT family N-acetyltransferase [Candidatus Colimonas fimequi]